MDINTKQRRGQLRRVSKAERRPCGHGSRSLRTRFARTRPHLWASAGDWMVL
jgi:hypothetical protein